MVHIILKRRYYITKTILTIQTNNSSFLQIWYKKILINTTYKMYLGLTDGLHLPFYLDSSKFNEIKREQS